MHICTAPATHAHMHRCEHICLISLSLHLWNYLWSWCLPLHLLAWIWICHAEIFPFVRKTSCDLSTSILLKVTLVVESAQCVSSFQNVLGCTEKIKAPSGSRWGGVLFFFFFLVRMRSKRRFRGYVRFWNELFLILFYERFTLKDLKGKNSYELTSLPTVLCYIPDWKMIISFNIVFSNVKTWLTNTCFDLNPLFDWRHVAVSGLWLTTQIH